MVLLRLRLWLGLHWLTVVPLPFLWVILPLLFCRDCSDVHIWGVAMEVAEDVWDRHILVHTVLHDWLVVAVEEVTQGSHVRSGLPSHLTRNSG